MDDRDAHERPPHVARHCFVATQGIRSISGTGTGATTEIGVHVVRRRSTRVCRRCLQENSVAAAL